MKTSTEEAETIIDKVEHDLTQLRYRGTERYRYAMGYLMGEMGFRESAIFRMRDVCDRAPVTLIPAPPRPAPKAQFDEGKAIRTGMVLGLLLSMAFICIFGLVAIYLYR